MVAQGDVSAAGFPDRGVCVAADTQVFRSADHPEAGILHPVEHPARFLARAGVIQHHVNILIGLRRKACDQLLQHVRVGVVYRHDNADGAGLRLVRPLLRKLRVRGGFLFPPPVVGAQVPLAENLPEAVQGIACTVAFQILPDPRERAHAITSLIH